jgi:glycosyltransferase involved in cell wall biosynthesis
VADDELPGLYATAICFVFPSQCEGFGLPIVEAFAAGCPVVLVEMNSALEVGGNAAQFFDADDEDTLAEIIERMADDPVSRMHWIDEGRKRAPDFRWYRTAELTRDVYRSVARQNK